MRQEMKHRLLPTGHLFCGIFSWPQSGNLSGCWKWVSLRWPPNLLWTPVPRTTNCWLTADIRSNSQFPRTAVSTVTHIQVEPSLPLLLAPTWTTEPDLGDSVAFAEEERYAVGQHCCCGVFPPQATCQKLRSSPDAKPSNFQFPTASFFLSARQKMPYLVHTASCNSPSFFAFGVRNYSLTSSEKQLPCQKYCCCWNASRVPRRTVCLRPPPEIVAGIPGSPLRYPMELVASSKTALLLITRELPNASCERSEITWDVLMSTWKNDHAVWNKKIVKKSPTRGNISSDEGMDGDGGVLQAWLGPGTSPPLLGFL